MWVPVFMTSYKKILVTSPKTPGYVVRHHNVIWKHHHDATRNSFTEGREVWGVEGGGGEGGGGEGAATDVRR